MGIQERKQREKERRRQQILIAAKRVFAQKGISKATMEDIATEAELSPGTLYLYFRNKDELFSSLTIRILQYLNIRLEHVANAEKDQSTDQRLQTLKEVMYDVYQFDPLMLVSMFHLQSSDTIKNLSPQLITDIQTLSQNAIRLIANLFQEIDRKDMADLSPETIADVLWSMFSGIVLLEESKKMISDDSSYLQKTLDTAFEIFGRGIRIVPISERERGENISKAYVTK